VTAKDIAECFEGQKATSKPASFPFF